MYLAPVHLAGARCSGYVLKLLFVHPADCHSLILQQEMVAQGAAAPAPLAVLRTVMQQDSWQTVGAPERWQEPAPAEQRPSFYCRVDREQQHQFC